MAQMQKAFRRQAEHRLVGQAHKRGERRAVMRQQMTKRRPFIPPVSGAETLRQTHLIAFAGQQMLPDPAEFFTILRAGHIGPPRLRQPEPGRGAALGGHQRGNQSGGGRDN